MIYCFMLTGKSISDAARTALFNAAVAMAKNGQNRRKVVHDDVTAIVDTDFEAMQIGTLAGYAFEAEIWTEKGKSWVRYIVQTQDLNNVGDAVWEPVVPRRKKRRSPSKTTPVPKTAYTIHPSDN